MKDAQGIIRDFNTKYNLEGSIETRFIDLSSEVGELGKEILRGTNYGEKEFSNTDNLESEFGDVLFSLVSVANCVGVDLGVALEEALNKYEIRFKEKRHIGSED